MTNPKYAYAVAQEGDVWTANIVRRVSARKSMVSKSQAGFKTEAEAAAWGEAKLKAFVDSLAERNQRKAAKREVRLEAEQAKALAAALALEAREDAEDEEELDDSANAWDLDDDLNDE